MGQAETPPSLRLQQEADNVYSHELREFYLVMADLAETSPTSFPWEEILGHQPKISNAVPLSVLVGKGYGPIFAIPGTYRFRAFTFEKFALLMGITPDAKEILDRHLEQLVRNDNDTAESTKEKDKLRAQLKTLGARRWTSIVRQFRRDGPDRLRMHVAESEGELELIWGDSRRKVTIEQLEAWVGSRDEWESFLQRFIKQLAADVPTARITGALLDGQSLQLCGSVKQANDRGELQDAALSLLADTAHADEINSVSAAAMVVNSETKNEQLNFLLLQGRDDPCQVDDMRLVEGSVFLKGSYPSAAELKALKQHVEDRLKCREVQLGLQAIWDATISSVDVTEMKELNLNDRIAQVLFAVAGVRVTVFGVDLDSEVLCIRGLVQDDQGRNAVADNAVGLLSEFKKDELIGKTFGSARSIKPLLLREDVSADIRAKEIADLFLPRQLHKNGIHVWISEITGDAKVIKIAGHVSNQTVREELHKTAAGLYAAAVRAKLLDNEPTIEVDSVRILDGIEALAVQSAQSIEGVRINDVDFTDKQLTLFGTLQAKDKTEESAVRNALNAQLERDLRSSANEIPEMPISVDVSWLVNDQLDIEDQLVDIIRRAMQDSESLGRDRLESIAIRRGGNIFIVELYGRVSHANNRTALKEIAGWAIRQQLERKVIDLNLKLEEVDVRGIEVGVPKSVCVVVDWSSFMAGRQSWLTSTLRNTPGFEAQRTQAFAVFLATPDAFVPWSWGDIQADKAPQTSPPIEPHVGGTLGAFGNSLAALTSDDASVSCERLHFVAFMPEHTTKPKPGTPAEIDQALGSSVTAETVRSTIEKRFPIEVWYASETAFRPFQELLGPRAINQYKFKDVNTPSYLGIDAEASK